MAREDLLLKLGELVAKHREMLLTELAGYENPANRRGSLIINDVKDAETLAQLAEIFRNELVQVEVALERIRCGAYGQCDVCGGKISLARLNALHYAVTCIECQRDIERQRQAEGVSPSEDLNAWNDVLEGPSRDGGSSAPLPEAEPPLHELRPDAAAAFERPAGPLPMSTGGSHWVVVSRRKNESIVIGDDIAVVVVEVGGSFVRLGAQVPKGSTVQQGELLKAMPDATSET